MTRPEREAITAVVERLPATVADWSDGLAALEPMHLVEVRRQLTSLSSSGEGRWWAGPRDCREEVAEHASDPRYDSIMVLWPSAPDVPLCGWGCSVEPSEATFGAGFTSIASDHWETLATAPDPEQGYVHEWLHHVEAIYRGLGVTATELPPLHDAGLFTSTRPTTEPPFGRSYAEYHDGTAGIDGAADATAANGGRTALPPARTWAPWYRDWMTGRLRRLDTDDMAAAETSAPTDAGAAADTNGVTEADAAATDAPATDAPIGAAADTNGVTEADGAATDAPATDAPIGLTAQRWALRSR